MSSKILQQNKFDTFLTILFAVLIKSLLLLKLNYFQVFICKIKIICFHKRNKLIVIEAVIREKQFILFEIHKENFYKKKIVYKQEFIYLCLYSGIFL